MLDCRNHRKDRFIPIRTSKNMNLIDEAMSIEQKNDSYEQLISKSLLGGSNYHMECNGLYEESNLYFHQIKQMFKNVMHENPKQMHRRNINPSPEKILDAPDLRDDYYLNLLDWSTRGTLAIGLAQRVYLYSPTQIRQLTYQHNEYICSLSFQQQGDLLAVGLSNGKTQIYDTQTQTLIRTLAAHQGRVSTVSFNYDMLFTGSRDSRIIGHDHRAQHSTCMKLQGHRGQVCGLKHDACGLASGSNDNTAMIWDLSMGRMRYQLHAHKAAVKALAWCPWQRNLLATGGGSSDKTMRFWNIENGKIINTVNTESQVCSLIWNKQQKQILSSHGFSENQLALWKVNSTSNSNIQCTKSVELHGHTQRVLHMALAPDNSTICTASADETLRFWKIFANSSSQDCEQKKSWCLNPKSITLR